MACVKSAFTTYRRSFFGGYQTELFLNGPIPVSFLTKFKYNLKSIDVVLGDRTQGRRVVGTDRSLPNQTQLNLPNKLN